MDEAIRLALEIGPLGQLRVAGRPILLGQVEKWAEGYITKHAEGQVIIRADGRALVEDVQWLLTELGHDPGPHDGVVGPRTRAAIEAFQTGADLPVDGSAPQVAAVEAPSGDETERLQVQDPDTGLYFLYDIATHALEVYDPKTHVERDAKDKDEIDLAMKLFRGEGGQ